MAYDKDKTWSDFEREVGNHARNVLETLHRSLEYYKDLVHYKNGRDNATIAAELGRTEADIDALEAAIMALKKLWDFSDGVAVAQGNYADDLRTFS